MDAGRAEELFSTIYAENSIEKMLSGHTYARAVRVQMLVHLAWQVKLWKQLTWLKGMKTLSKKRTQIWTDLQFWQQLKMSSFK